MSPMRGPLMTCGSTALPTSEPSIHPSCGTPKNEPTTPPTMGNIARAIRQRSDIAQRCEISKRNPNDAPLLAPRCRLNESRKSPRGNNRQSRQCDAAMWKTSSGTHHRHALHHAPAARGLIARSGAGRLYVARARNISGPASAGRYP